MGWGRMLLLGNWGQQMDIEDQKQEIESLKQQIETGSGSRDTSTLKNRIALLEKENGELRLYLASLIKYLGHKGILRQDEFRELIESIDAEDGSADGSYKGNIMD
jgi:cell division septum initiation protein DivIVA